MMLSESVRIRPDLHVFGFVRFFCPGCPDSSETVRKDHQFLSESVRGGYIPPGQDGQK